MTKENKVERQVKKISIICIGLMTVLAIILAIRLMFVDCPSCFFADSLFNKAVLYLLIGVLIGYIACIPIMIYKVRQSKKVKVTDDDCDCDEGSCSY